MGAKKLISKLIRVLKAKEMIPIPQPINAQKILEGKTALITGGSSGIGLAIAKAFLSSGCKVVIAGTNEEKLKNAINTLGGGTPIVIDVRDVASLPMKIKQAAESLHVECFDILVNSAGLVAKSDFFHMTEQEYDRIMDTNAKGTYFMCKVVSELMIEKKVKGHILNVSSSSALRPAWTPYQLSKWAVRGMTLGLADELLPYGIIVNAIAPGQTATPMLGRKEGDSLYNSAAPIGRYAEPSEIAALATFMVSSMGDMIVGDTFYMTGGSGTISMHR